MKPAEITLQQLGGMGRLRAMINARDIFADNDGRTLLFKFSGCPKANSIRITVNHLDLYDVEFVKIHRSPSLKQLIEGKEHKMPTTVEKLENVGVENLRDVIEEFTGLYLSMGTMGR